MSLDRHIQSLRSRHASLEAELKNEAARPHPDTLNIAKLKKEKLRLKDEIERMAH